MAATQQRARPKYDIASAGLDSDADSDPDDGGPELAGHEQGRKLAQAAQRDTGMNTVCGTCGATAY